MEFGEEGVIKGVWYGFFAPFVTTRNGSGCTSLLVSLDFFFLTEIKEYYDEWAASYDSDLSELKYNFPEIVAKKAVSLTTQEQREKWSFLDLGTGKS